MTALVSTATVMALAGILGLVNYPYRYHAVAEHATFVVAVIGSFVLAGRCCERHYSPMRFMGLLCGFSIVLVLLTWPVLWISLMIIFFNLQRSEVLEHLPTHFAIALAAGVGLFLGVVPFMMVAFFVPVYKRQLTKILRLIASRSRVNDRPAVAYPQE
ncbi:MAG: hypothetical protein HY706_19070 [Candidatus Hydrogenedentes bacterium]|nr:hypothetical protein [Candidatus Hydrogenedentota bacterium]